jgi:circadian clock protein KaiC
MTDEAALHAQSRISTGVPGLDAILYGGFLPRSVYMVQGRPGGGKTILANQISFHHAAHGGHVLYVTLLAETHERLLHYIQQLDFFDAAQLSQQVSYLSGFSTLQDSGLKGLAELLRREARTRNATLLIVDGLVAAQERAESSNEFKKFIQELQIHASLIGHTVLLLTSASAHAVRPEHTMADGVVELSDNRQGHSSERELEVKKLRGSDYLRGGHAFQITSSGITVFPRLEALLANPSHEDTCKNQRVSTGIASLDAMLHGGLRCASTTVLFGPTGGGKTSIGLHFLSQSTHEEPGLLFGFYETPRRALLKATALGLDLEAKVAEGVLDLQWSPPTERILDALGHQLLTTVKARGAKRVFIDGVDGLLKAATYPQRISHFLSALTNELRVRGVTALYTAELQHIFSNEVMLPMEGISSLVENILLVRFVEIGGRVMRVLSVIKTRDSAYDDSLRELVISSRGVELASTIESSFGAQHNMSPASGESAAARAVRRLLRKRGKSS